MRPVTFGMSLWKKTRTPRSTWVTYPTGWNSLPDFRAPDVDGAQYRKSTTFDLSQATDEFDEAAWSVYE